MSVDLDKSRLSKDAVLASIPAFPPIVLRVLDLLSRDIPDTSLLAHEIASDATLAAQVLRLANSPLFGFAARIGTVRHALSALGLIRVQSLVMAVAATNYMKSALRTEALDKCWRHTLASAIICRELARAARMPEDRAYSFGLLHDLGRLGLLVAYPEAYDRILRIADRDAVSLLDQEQRLFGLDHCEAGHRLVEQWKLPEDFRVIAGRHHDPQDGGPFDFLHMVYLACQLADTLGYFVVTPLRPVPYVELCDLLPMPARQAFSDDPQMLTEIIDGTIGEHHFATEMPMLEQHSLTIQREPSPAPPGAAPGKNDPAGTPQMFATLTAAPTAWDLTVVLATVLVFAAVLLGFHLLWGR